MDGDGDQALFMERRTTRMNRTRMLLVTLVLAAVAAVLLLSIDFQAANSASSMRSTVARMTVGTIDRPEGGLVLFVDGSGDLDAYLEKELVRRLESMAGIAGVTVVNSMTDGTGWPMLAVQARGDALNWTPAYAKASVVTRIVYASDGDMSWRDDTSVAMGRPDRQSQLRVRGDLELADTTWGVVSRPAYRRHLAQQIASAVSDVLKEQVYKNG